VSFRSTLIGRVHIVRWKQPELKDVSIIIRELREGFEQNKKPIFGVAIIPLSAMAPTDDARSAMSDRLPELLKYAETLHFVMEGSGFKQSALRSIVSGVVVLRGERGRIVVHNSFDAAVRHIEARLGMPQKTFMQRVAASKILEDL
jgi:hypothetical protein